MKTKVFNMAVVIISAAIFMAFFFYSNGFNKLVDAINKGNMRWLLVAIFLMFFYWLFETLIIHTLTLFIYSRQTLLQSFKAAMVGQFFSSITPYQTGAQPALFVVLKKNGVDSGSASSILMMKFVVHQTVLTVYSFIIIILKFSYFDSRLPHLFYLCLAGFIMNTGIILLAIMFSINKTVTKGFLTGILIFLHKIRIVKNADKYTRKIEFELVAFHDNAALIAKNYRVLLKTVLINTLQLTVFYAIPYCIYRSFNLTSASLWNMLAAQTFVMMISSIMPLPGGSLAAELSFSKIFSMFFTDATNGPAIFLWRLITYYSCIGIGGLFAIFIPTNTTQQE